MSNLLICDSWSLGRYIVYGETGFSYQTVAGIVNEAFETEPPTVLVNGLPQKSSQIQFDEAAIKRQNSKPETHITTASPNDVKSTQDTPDKLAAKELNGDAKISTTDKLDGSLNKIEISLGEAKSNDTGSVSSSSGSNDDVTGVRSKSGNPDTPDGRTDIDNDAQDSPKCDPETGLSQLCSRIQQHIDRLHAGKMVPASDHSQSTGQTHYDTASAQLAQCLAILLASAEDPNEKGTALPEVALHQLRCVYDNACIAFYSRKGSAGTGTNLSFRSQSLQMILLSIALEQISQPELITVRFSPFLKDFYAASSELAIPIKSQFAQLASNSSGGGIHGSHSGGTLSESGHHHANFFSRHKLHSATAGPGFDALVNLTVDVYRLLDMLDVQSNGEDVKSRGTSALRDKLTTIPGLDADMKMRWNRLVVVGGFTKDHSMKRRLDSKRSIVNLPSLSEAPKPDTSLVYVKHEKLPVKDFSAEIRATKDMDHLLETAVVLLDVADTGLEDILCRIITEMADKHSEVDPEQVKEAIFTREESEEANCLSRTVQSITTSNTVGGSFDYDQAWMCAFCILPTLQHRHIAIARLAHPINFGRTMQDLRFIILIVAPVRSKGTKTALETARTFSTLFSNLDVRQCLVMCHDETAFRQTLHQAAGELSEQQNFMKNRKTSVHMSEAKEELLGPDRWYIGRGVIQDVKRRLPHYISDYTDAFRDRKSIQKVTSTTVFLYFAILLPSIALGVLNLDNSHGAIGVKKVIFAQAIGGLFFSIFGGQPMIIIMTTAPISIYIKIISRISEKFDVDFFAMYAWCGIWCQIFLIIYALTELSNILKWATRSIEEIFALFIAIAFFVEAMKSMSKNFKTYYHADECDASSVNFRQSYTVTNISTSLINSDYTSVHNSTTSIFEEECHRDSSLLYLLLMFGTLWIGLFLYNFKKTHAITSTTSIFEEKCHRDSSVLYFLFMFGTLWIGLFLYNFKKTPYLNISKREILADYALPVAVIVMTITGVFIFAAVDLKKFTYDANSAYIRISNIAGLSAGGIIGAMGLGFCLSLLFFIDQNMSDAIVNNPQNKLHKGSATHWDLLVVGILNMFLSICGLPWMHAALPHSPLHVRALADVEERVQMGHVYDVITNVRETRLSTFICHIFMGISVVCLLPSPLNYIPRSVLDGLFLYMAFTSLHGNEMFERVMLFFTEQAAYPPTHYIRRVPQRKVHLFTLCQMAQLGLLCIIGFMPEPYVEMVFPVVLFSFLPIRMFLIPKLVESKYLDALDGLKH